MGTTEACLLPTVAAHFRLNAQMISVNTAMPRMTQAKRRSSCGNGLGWSGARTGNPKEAARR